MDRHFIKTKNGNIFCKVFGKGTPIIFLHGGPGMFHDYLLPHFDQLAEKYMLIFYDQNGSGLSTLKDKDIPLTIGDFVQTLKDIKHYFNIEKFHCISHSFGALIALNYMLKYPNDLLSNIMISPAPGNDTYDKKGQKNLLNRISKDDMEQMQQIMSQKPFEKQDMVLINQLLSIKEKGRYLDTSFLAENPISITFEAIEKLQLISAKLNDELDNYDIYSQLSNCITSSIIIHGDYDAIPIISSKKYHENLPNSELFIVEECGHFPFIEKKKRTLSIIIDFLNKI